MPFGLQPIHIVVLVVVALIIFGPSKLPEMGRSLGKAITEFRRGTQEMAEGFKEEVIKPVKEPTTPSEPANIAQPPIPAPIGSMQTCPQCHTANPSSARFCNQCGAVLTVQDN